MSTYRPSIRAWEETSLARFIAEGGYGSLPELQAISVADPERFWRDVVRALDLQWIKPFTKVLDLSRGKPWAQWFVGGELDLFDNLLGKHARRTPDKVALRWEDEDGHTREMTYAQAYDEALRLAAGLSRIGVGRGDRIALYLPMAPEAALVLVAAARLGAITMPLFSGYGRDAVASRVRDCEASVLVCADAFTRRGKRVDMLAEARAAAATCPTLRHVIVVARGATGQKRAATEPAVPEVDYRELVADATEPTPSSWGADTDLMIIYTSGTTGRPKGVVHTHTGFPLKSAQDMMMAFDFGPDDVLMWVTDMGWMMGPWLVYGGLLCGGTIVLYEGTPDVPSRDRLWRLVQRHGITHLGVSPTLIRLLMADGDRWVRPDLIGTLRAFGSTGEPWNDAPWTWLFEVAGEGKRPIVNYSGGTEIGGGILGCLPGLPLRPCAFSGPLPGIDAGVAAADGTPARTGEVGELVIRNVWPGMAKGFWRDDARYLETYWSRFDNVWVHGDWARIDEDGQWFIMGRSDDTIKVAGKRVGPAEYESVLVAHPLVVEAVAIGVPDELKGESAVCFVTASGERSPEGAWHETEAALKAHVAASLGKPLVPKRVHLVTALPKTRNGKVLRRVVKNAYLGRDMGDLTSLDNPACIASIRACAADADAGAKK